MKKAFDPSVVLDDMTARQREILYFLNLFRDRNQCNPTCQEIAQAFNFASANASNEHLQALARRGVIHYRDGAKARGYVVARGFVREGIHENRLAPIGVDAGRLQSPVALVRNEAGCAVGVGGKS